MYLACAVHFHLASHFLHDGMLVRAQEEAARLMALGRHYHDVRTESFGHWLMGWIAFQEFRYEAAFNHAEHSLANAITEADRLIGLGLKGVALTMLGQAGEGLKLLQTVRGEAFKRGDMHLVFAVDPGLSIALILTGQPRAGFRQLRSILTYWRLNGYGLMVSYGHLLLGELYTRLTMPKGSRPQTVRLRLLDRLLLIPHILFGRRRAHRHLRIAAQTKRWSETSAAAIRIQLALALLETGRRSISVFAMQRLTVARQIALAAGLPKLAETIEIALQGRFETP